MNKQIEALKMAIAWIKNCRGYLYVQSELYGKDAIDADGLGQQTPKLLEALDEALAEAEKQEPVAWTSTKALENAKLLGTADLWIEFDEDYSIEANEIGSKSKQIPLYTHPATWQSLKVKAVINYGNNSQLLFIDEISGLHMAIDMDSFALADIAEKQLNNFFSKV